MSQKKKSLEVPGSLLPPDEPTVKEAINELIDEFQSRREETFFGFEVVEELQEYLNRIKNNA
jgi:hypothetical protein